MIYNLRAHSPVHLHIVNQFWSHALGGLYQVCLGFHQGRLIRGCCVRVRQCDKVRTWSGEIAFASPIVRRTGWLRPASHRLHGTGGSPASSSANAVAPRFATLSRFSGFPQGIHRFGMQDGRHVPASRSEGSYARSSLSWPRCSCWCPAPSPGLTPERRQPGEDDRMVKNWKGSSPTWWKPGSSPRRSPTPSSPSSTR